MLWEDVQFMLGMFFGYEYVNFRYKNDQAANGVLCVM